MEILLDDWKVCPDNLTLKHGDKVFHLEPRSMDLLLFLLKQNGKVVTRDALVEHVWSGMIVSDHAVTSCVAKIRKVFNEEDNKSVIETISKRGYRICPQIDVTFLDDEIVSQSEAQADIEKSSTATIIAAESSAQPSIKKPQVLFTYTGLVLLSGLLAFAIISKFDLGSKKSVLDYQYSLIEPVTSLNGLEYKPTLSPNGNFLSYLYSDVDSAKWSIHVMDKESSKILYVIDNVSEYSNHVWSPDSDAILFHRFSKGQCQLLIGNLSKNTGLVEETIATTCYQHSEEVNVAWDSDKALIYYNESNSEQDPRAIFQVNIYTGKKLQLTTPTEVGFGDYNPLYFLPNNSIYFLRNKYWKKETSIMRLSLDTNSLSTIHSIDKLLAYLALDKNGNPVYQVDENKIALKELDTDEEHILYSSTTSIAQPVVGIEDGSLYFVAESNSEKDIRSYSLGTKGLQLGNVNNSRDDFAPVFANQSELYAFFSNRTGTRQIYVYDYNGNAILKTNLERDANPVNLVWSRSDETLYFSQGTFVYELDIASAKVSRVDFPLEYIQLNAATDSGSGFYFSSDHNNDWQIYQFENGAITQLTEGGGYIGDVSSNNEYLYFTKFRELGLWRKNLLSGKEEVFIKGIDLSVPGSFNLFDDGIVYKLKTSTGFDVYKYSFENQSISTLASIVGEKESPFSVSYNQQHILYEKIAEDAKADIMRASR
ncbi:winged helix-turn-helix domain-containing protein [Glaciecola sp. MH2013]|uniref:winged helix-turn-helix domain-containing protein n=1 Tax=Glaciecola sp. MH2013 TaxID=2785524 RepID=UPI00189E6A53|nr:winged helix-turn-helix domain-containing protein [Glaciecola sp. MH2013]MBF7073496.1 winged helix-turn-helix domain-containing protein [Glaciecola sp. MH2013]